MSTSLTTDNAFTHHKRKVGDLSGGIPMGSLFNCYNTKVSGKALLLSLDCQLPSLTHNNPGKHYVIIIFTGCLLVFKNLALNKNIIDNMKDILNSRTVWLHKMFVKPIRLSYLN